MVMSARGNYTRLRNYRYQMLQGYYARKDVVTIKLIIPSTYTVHVKYLHGIDTILAKEQPCRRIKHDEKSNLQDQFIKKAIQLIEWLDSPLNEYANFEKKRHIDICTGL